MIMPNKYITEESIQDVFYKIATETLEGEGPQAVGALQEFMGQIAFSVESKKKEGVTYYNAKELTYFFENWLQAFEKGDPQYLTQEKGMKHEPVDIKEFTISPQYLDQEEVVRPAILAQLERLFYTDRYIEAVLSGAIGIGKNFMANYAIAYMIYRISCHRSPQAAFGIAPNSGIVLIAQSATFRLAKKVVFENLATLFRNSSYFKNNYPADPSIKTELLFPGNVSILPASSADTATLGMNVFGGIIDEINFMPRVKGSQQAKFRGEEEHNKAKNLYQTIIRRMKSRFLQKGGKLPGKLLLVASANYPGDFTDEKREEAKHDKTIFFMSLPQWAAFYGTKDYDEKYSGEKFLVEVGDDRFRSRILKNEGEARKDAEVMEIPIEYEKDFKQDIDSAMRDIAGRPTSHLTPFIPQKDLIMKSTETRKGLVGDGQIFSQTEVDLFHYNEDTMRDIINQEYIDTYIKGWRDHECFATEPMLAVHIDSALSSDNLGMALGRVIGFSDYWEHKAYVQQKDRYIPVRGLRAPIILYDGLLKVVPPSIDDIDLNKIQQLIYLLLELGVPIKWLSMDAFESAQLMGNVRRHARIRTAKVSVDKKLEPYMGFKLGITEERVLFPEHTTLQRELPTLILDRKLGKVDHREDGSKDVADAACGVHFLLSKLRATFAHPSARMEGVPLKEMEQESAGGAGLEDEQEEGTKIVKQDMLKDRATRERYGRRNRVRIKKR